MKRIFLIGTAAMSLAACSTTYGDMLEQKLAGKSEQEKRAILAQECANEVNSGMKSDRPKSAKHFANFRSICEEMTGQKINTGTAQ